MSALVGYRDVLAPMAVLWILAAITNVEWDLKDRATDVLLRAAKTLPDDVAEHRDRMTSMSSRIEGYPWKSRATVVLWCHRLIRAQSAISQSKEDIELRNKAISNTVVQDALYGNNASH